MANFLSGAGEITDALLQTQLPRIRELYVSKVGPAFASVARDDGRFKALSETVYALLPSVVRLAVKEDAFVRYCFAQRAKLVALPTPAPAGSAPAHEHLLPAGDDAAPTLPAEPPTYRLAQDGEEFGSLTERALRKVIDAGVLSGQDYYLDPVANEWVALDQFPWSA